MLYITHLLVLVEKVDIEKKSGFIHYSGLSSVFN